MFVSWNMTKACNLRCKHCYRDAGERDEHELNTIEGKHLLFELRESGFDRIIFSGGEALLRDDIYELIEYADRIGAPLEVIENLAELEDNEEVFECIEDIWPDYPTDEDYFFNDDDEFN